MSEDYKLIETTLADFGEAKKTGIVDFVTSHDCPNQIKAMKMEETLRKLMQIREARRENARYHLID